MISASAAGRPQSFCGLKASDSWHDPAQNTGENRPREVSHLFVLQANVLQPADDLRPVRQHDADQQHNHAQTHDAAAGEPFAAEQGGCCGYARR